MSFGRFVIYLMNGQKDRGRCILIDQFIHPSVLFGLFPTVFVLLVLLFVFHNYEFEKHKN